MAISLCGLLFWGDGHQFEPVTLQFSTGDFASLKLDELIGDLVDSDVSITSRFWLGVFRNDLTLAIDDLIAGLNRHFIEGLFAPIP